MDREGLNIYEEKEEEEPKDGVVADVPHKCKTRTVTAPKE